ncbi:NAD(P)-dependent alcohol dehydrogenase [Actinocorallia sp. A-T 12471]|uniref:NAD(P)-dependent alcohol dehydrogenase n=1 Tax=Actinocorallia sp. A-T 12471 TaxID=3089813 RepID=UPI0029CDE917|nr:NAD(P)-dependent alcohol dehydrogenase [Actinocorallia sp. A-T 12471]MDX6742137.1 NAD(P)-dependent alcohol dehydrogenase [Actinocorallia sp. A-T 12471]
MTESRAAVLRDPAGPFSIETVIVDAPRPGEALVRVVGAGMCHTDQLGRAGVFGEAFLPAVLGHEGSGVVEAVGPGVSSVEPGDHVVLSFDYCGTCPACLSGAPANCALFELSNLTGLRPDGSGSAKDASGAPLTSRWFAQSSFAHYTLATERNMVKVAKDVPLALLGPLGCGIQTGAGAVLNTARLSPGESIAVFGVGAVGLAAIMAAKASGAGDIVAVDLNPARREAALRLGATRAVDGAHPDLATEIRAGGPGVDVTFDTTGVTAAMSAAVEVLTRPGRCVLVGAGMDLLTVHPASLVGKTVTYVYEGDAIPQLFIPRLITLWKKGLFPFDELITTYPLADINQAEADTHKGTVIKPVLLMDAEA